jgi:anti-sigma regulatory factor (Ser/Thr protein kinase)
MKLNLPNSAFLGNIDAFLKSIDRSDPDILEITSNPKWVSVHPVVLCMVASLGLEVVDKNKVSKPVKCRIFTARSKHYFKRMRLFDFLNVDSKIDIIEHEPAGRFIPLTQITHKENLTKFIEDVVPLLHLEPKHAQPIKYIISELVRNVLEHSNSKYGAIVCAQYHLKSNTIRIGIVDTGVGISKTIRKSHFASTDLDAIQLALTPGITGTTSKEGGTDYNAGAGLFFIKSIAKINRDYFIIYSGNTLYKLLKEKGGNKIVLYSDPLIDKHSKKTDLPNWTGTVVGIDINLTATEEFTTLLDTIRDVYVKSVRERKKDKHKKPKFI